MKCLIRSVHFLYLSQTCLLFLWGSNELNGSISVTRVRGLSVFLSCVECIHPNPSSPTLPNRLFFNRSWSNKEEVSVQVTETIQAKDAYLCESLQRRGHNIVTVYPNGSIHASKGFDTFGSSDNVAEMKGFIESLPDNLIVLIAVWDSTNPNKIRQIEGAESALYSLGAVAPVAPLVREAWLLAGHKGPEKPAWIQQRHTARNMGPVTLWTEVVL